MRGLETQIKQPASCYGDIRAPVGLVRKNPEPRNVLLYERISRWLPAVDGMVEAEVDIKRSAAKYLARFIEDAHVVVAIPEVQSDGQFTNCSFFCFHTAGDYTPAFSFLLVGPLWARINASRKCFSPGQRPSLIDFNTVFFRQIFPYVEGHFPHLIARKSLSPPSIFENETRQKLSTLLKLLFSFHKSRPLFFRNSIYGGIHENISVGKLFSGRFEV